MQNSIDQFEVDNFFDELRSLNLLLVREDDKLVLKGTRDLTPDQMDQVRQNKKLITYIRENKANLLKLVDSSQNNIIQGNPNVVAIYRLSGLQEGMLFHSLYDDSVQAYIEQFVSDISSVDPGLLKQSWQEILRRHSILRSSFHYDTFNIPVQCVYDEVALPVAELDYSHLEGAAQEAALAAYEESDRDKGFDLDQAPLMRLTLIRLGTDRYRMVWTSHHLLFDGWSFAVIMEELREVYGILESSAGLPHYKEDIYQDYIRHIGRQDKYKEEAYWKEYLSGLSTPVLLPFIGNVADRNKGIGRYGQEFLSFDKDYTKKLHEYARAKHLTMNTLMQGVWSYLLYRYSGEDHVVFGVTVSGRPEELPGVERRVGMYINTLPFHTVLSEDMEIGSWLQDLQLGQATCRQYQYSRLQDIQRWVGISGDLFDSLLVFENYPVRAETFVGGKGLELSQSRMREHTNYPLGIVISGDEELWIEFSYNSRLLDSSYVDQILGHFKHVLEQIVDGGSSQRIGDLSLLTATEEHQLLEEFNDTDSEYPKDKTIVDLLMHQSKQQPDAVALVYGDSELTYGELDRRSNQLGHYLRDQGVKEDVLVGICLDRSVEMIVGILGILKAGGAYVPIDPDYPSDRIDYVLTDIEASVILSNSSSVAALPSGHREKALLLDSDWAQISKEAEVPVENDLEPHHLAYIIYTSGSTGRPKGVMIEHRNVVRLFETSPRLYTFNEEDVWTMFHSFCFDFSVWEMYGALFYGGRLVIVPRQVARDIEAFGQLLSDQQVSILNQTPSAFYALQEHMVSKEISTNLRYVVFGGEALDPSRLVSWEKQYPDCQLINMYGITETTVHVTYQEIKDVHLWEGGSIIGKAIPTLSIYMLDDLHRMVPFGAIGEICVSGAGLARGYLHRPELTSEKFIPHPFVTGERLYLSGDLGRWLPDGRIEYLGRKDNQVKVRGYRIELGEIESALHQSGLVKDGVVIAGEGAKGRKRLMGYVVPDGSYDPDKLIAYLKSRLPSYMVPHQWMELDSLPLTKNGKIDKKSLPSFDTGDIQSEFVAPRSSMEKALSDIWSEVLSVDRVGLHDNFFGLGGDSIITIQITSRAKRSGYDIRPRDIFLHPTIGQLSHALESGTSSAPVRAEQGVLTGVSGLLPIQQWYFAQGHPFASLSHYNQSMLLTVKKGIDMSLLSQSLQLLQEHHDALRYRYKQTPSGWVQEYGVWKTELQELDLTDVSRDKFEEALSYHATLYQQGLDILKGELFKAVYIRTSGPEDRLLLVVHHLGVDGVSWRILLEDLELLLSGADLGSKSSSYRDWYAALETYLGHGRLLSQKSYWSGVVESFRRLPVDRAYEGDVHMSDWDIVSVRLSTAQTRSLLQSAPSAYHTEINDLLLSSLVHTICQWSGASDVVVGLEGHGREEHVVEELDLSRTVGWFTSIFPVALSNSEGFSSLIKSTKERLRQLPDKGLGYGVLRYLGEGTGLSNGSDGDPWEIVFNYLGQYDNLLSESAWFGMSDDPRGSEVSTSHVSGVKLTINSMIVKGELVLHLGYSGQHYNRETVEDLASTYQSHLEDLIGHCTSQADQGSVFTPSDYGLEQDINHQELDSFMATHPGVVAVYGLSGLQEGMLFHSLYDDGVQAYLEQFVSDIPSVDPVLLKQSWKEILRRHSIFRSSFHYDTFNIPVQCVYDEVALPVAELDYSHLDGAAQESALAAFEESDRDKGIDLDQAPLMRLTLIRLSADRYRMVWTSHHLLFDGWSLAVLMEELQEVYAILQSSANLPHYKEDLYQDYIRYIGRQDKYKEEAYWQEYLFGVSAPVLLPYIGNVADRNKGIGRYGQEFLIFDKDYTKKLHEYVKANHLTMNTLMQGVWSYLLYRYSGEGHVVFGVTVSGRPEELPGVERRVGMYINTLPFHTVLSEDMEIGSWLQDLQLGQATSRQYQYSRLQDIQRWVGISGDLFDSLLVFENYPVRAETFTGGKGLELSESRMREHTNYPLGIVISGDEELWIEFSYNSRLLDSSYVDQIQGHFKHVLEQIVDGGSGQRIGGLSLLTASEEHQLLKEFNDTVSVYPKEKTIVDLLMHQSKQRPDAVALVYRDRELTYGELDRRSNQLGHYLRSRGVKEDVLVGLCLDRSVEMIVGILGILKAGGAYVPIDPDYPTDRIDYVLNDIEASVILSNSSSAAALPSGHREKALLLDSDWSKISKEAEVPVANNLESHHLAYIIYTSGSTGKPKGVMIEHRNVVRLFETSPRLYTFNEEDVWTMLHSFCFDFSVWEMYGALFYGGRLVIVPHQVARDIEAFGQLLSDQQVSILNQTPSAFYALQEHMVSKGISTNLRYVIFGGDALDPSRLVSWEKQYPDCQLINMYGITETTVHVTYQEIKDVHLWRGGSIIGKAIPTLSIYILDELHRVVPFGVTGEICVSGAGLARGYLHRPELTSQKFIPHPFVAGERLYLSGDLGRWLPDGRIEYLGRKDNQVKVRGYRIELGEIESVLHQSGLVKDGVVIAAEGAQGTKRLMGYVVPEGAYDPDKLIAYLKSRLPSYMVPHQWMELNSLPLTKNGKIDKKSLPSFDPGDIQSEYVAPRSSMEKALSDIWSEVLSVDRVGLHDNFFGLGGDSIITIQITSRAKRSGYDIRPRDIFLHPTIGQLSHALESGTSSAPVRAEQGVLTGVSGLLPIQQWYFAQGHPFASLSHYNQSMLLTVKKGIDMSLLSQSIQLLQEHHDALRYRYEQTPSGWVQEYGLGKYELIELDLTYVSRDKLEEVLSHHAYLYQQGLDINKGELFKAVYIRTSGHEDRLLLVVHHLGVDGVSWRILLEDLELLLSGADLGAKSSSYRDWYGALEAYLGHTRLLSQKSYWSGVAASFRPLPVDRAYEGDVLMGDLGQVSVSLSSSQTRSLLQSAPSAYHTEINDLLLSSLVHTICQWSGASEVVVGLEGHGREEHVVEELDISRTVGWFTSIFPVALSNSKGFSSLIKSTKERLRQLPDKGLGYGVLRYLGDSADLSNGSDGDPWEIVFNYLGQYDNLLSESTWFGVSDDPRGAEVSTSHVSGAKLTINSMIVKGELVLHWGYSGRHYNQETVEDLANTYLSHLEDLIGHCTSQAGQGSVFTPSDYGLEQEVNHQELDSFMATHPDVVAVYRLSGLQEGMLFHSLYDDGVQAYIEQFVSDISSVDPALLKQSWEEILRRHSILRSSFHYDTFNIPVQSVYDKVPLPVAELDYSHLEGAAQEAALAAFEESDRDKGVDLDQAPLMRLTLIRLGADRYRMVWASHHMLFDGWSFSVLMEELREVYGILESGANLPHYKEDLYQDYIRYIGRQDKYKEENYWQEYLSGVSTPILLPFIGNAADRTKGIGRYGQEFLFFDKDYTKKLYQYAKSNHLTLNTLMQGVWSYLLYRYCGEGHVVFGVTVSGRPEELPGVERRVGMYINTLPFHTVLSEDMEIGSWLQDLQLGQATSRQYQYSRLQDIQRWVGISGDLFDSLLIFENYPVRAETFAGGKGLELSQSRMREQTNYPLGVIISGQEQLWIEFSYNSRLLDSSYVDQIMGHFKHVLEQIVAGGSSQRIGDLSLLTATEEHQLLEEFNDTDSEYSKDKTIVDLFIHQSKQRPDAIALVYGDKELTYWELDRRSNQLGHYLRSQGVKEDVLVGLCLDRSLEMIVGILGILKAGGAYVPIDPDYPADRIDYVLNDIEASVILSNASSVAALPSGHREKALLLDSDWSKISEEAEVPVENNLGPHHLAYIIYTSGSTGKPKGVMIEHRNVMALLFGYLHLTGDESTGSGLSLCPYVFDVSVWEFFINLCFGNSLHILSKEYSLDPEGVLQYLDEHGITTAYIPPSILPAIVEGVSSDGNCSLKRLLVGVMSIKQEVLEELHNKCPDLRIINGYGPAESTVCSTFYEFRDVVHGLPNTPIGKPVNNYKVFIVDHQGVPTPVGVPGEIWIAGDGLGRGYLNQPDLISEKFINHPLLPDGCIYRSGDYGRWLPDGNIEFIGRIDDQVKVRGYRIELGEIESVLQQCDLVKQAVVTAQEDEQGMKYLIGYIVPNGVYDQQGILSYIRKILPQYMVPNILLEISHLPVTNNGKINRNELPEVDLGKASLINYAAPQTSIEKSLIQIWEETFLIENIGINDNFFVLGGDSIKATRLAAQIQKRFGVTLPIRSILENSTIHHFAAFLEGTKKEMDLPPLITGKRSEFAPLSYSQERLWFIDRLEGSLHYHVPKVFCIKGPLNIDALENAFQELVTRHEILRTVYREQEGSGYQHVLPSGSWKLGRLSGNQMKGSERSIQDHISELVDQPFDLSLDYMLRADLIEVDHQFFYLVLTIHHIAVDAWSWDILTKELSALYDLVQSDKAINLPDMELQYGDYAQWQRDYLSGEILDKKMSYWEEQLSESVPLELPTDYARPSLPSRVGGLQVLHVDMDLYLKLQAMGKDQGATLFMLCLAAFKVLLYRYSGQRDINVGTPIASRSQAETENLIGFFLNTLVLRSHIEDSSSFLAFLQQVKETTLSGYEHQGVPFEKIVEKMVTERDLGQNPLFQVMFVMQNATGAPSLLLSDVEVFDEPLSGSHPKFDITFSVEESEEGLYCSIEFDRELYREESINQMLLHYKNLLDSIIKAPTTAVMDLNMLSVAEEHRLLKEFNDTYSEYPKDKTIVDLFAQQASHQPESVAVVAGERKLTYEELDRRSNQLGHYLRRIGVKENVPVAICIDRSLEMIIGIVGILKSGGAYVPIDPDYPADRINYMLTDIDASVILSGSSCVDKLPVSQRKKAILLDQHWEIINSESQEYVDNDQGPDSLAYVIYTSGSTGKPKGIQMGNKALVNLLTWQKNSIDNGKNILQYASLNFDVSFQEIFTSLGFGGKLYLINEEVKMDMQKLLIVLIEHQINYLFIPYVVLKNIAEYANEYDFFPTELNKIFTAGEQLKMTEDISNFLKNANCKLINQYGPSETHVVSSYEVEAALYKDHPLPPIGAPISNTSIYVLDDAGNLAPAGVKGQICIAGDSLSHGYWSRPALTNEKFIDNKFGDATRLYLTGDIGRWNTNGQLEYIGRVDNQVKIRGFRVELGEIESIVQQSDLVKQVVVVTNKDQTGQLRLVAYVVPDQAFEKPKLQKYLKSQMPNYMMPSIWITVDEIPVTNNGKVNKQQLPPVDSSFQEQAPYLPPVSPFEKDMALIWQELLGIERIGIHDNFFELGGHSLIIFQIMNKVRKLKYQITFKDFFKYQTISELSNYLFSPVGDVMEGDTVDSTSSAEEHVMLLNEGDTENTIFILPGAPGFYYGYDELAAAFNESANVYGVQVMGLNEGEKPLMSMPQNAEQMISWIKDTQPNGPYRFIGHSLGAHIAFEITKQLEKIGEEVEYLVILDTSIHLRSVLNLKAGIDAAKGIVDAVSFFLWSWNVTPDSVPEWAGELQRLIKSLPVLEKYEATIDYVRQKMGDIHNAEFLLRALRAFISQSQMIYYPTGKVNCEVVVVKAMKENWEQYNEYLGWDKLATTIQKITTPGDHMSLVRGENAITLVEKISKTF